MDGLEAAEKIMEYNAGVPIVAMTANIMSNDREIYKLKGMDDCVGKPFTSQELWRCLMKYLKPVGWQKMEETRNTQNEDKLHQRLINSFVRDNRNRYGEITEALKAGDIKLAHRLAHTLKSNAGFLGKTLLQKAAADIEHQLADGQNLVTAEQMAALEKELTAALAELEPLAADVSRPAAAAAGAEPVSAETALALIDKLAPMLEQGDLGARQFIDELRGIPGSEDLIQRMEDLDFDLAIAALNELKKAWKQG
jgi:HPt (histidine-containing phosphotransfer) domain-containing protein